MRKLTHDVEYNLKFKEEFVKIKALSGVSTMNNTQTQNYFTQQYSKNNNKNSSDNNSSKLITTTQ